VEKLAEMGVILKPRDEQSSKRKGKGKAAPSGHVIFVDGREQCKWIYTVERAWLTRSRKLGERQYDSDIIK
jgi:hypothetical protein